MTCNHAGHEQLLESTLEHVMHTLDVTIEHATSLLDAPWPSLVAHHNYKVQLSQPMLGVVKGCLVL